MAYEPTNWKPGDIVTSAKLNKLENAVTNGCGKVFIVHTTLGDSVPPVLRTLETAGEICQAAMEGNALLVVLTASGESGFSNDYAVPKQFSYEENASDDNHKYYMIFADDTFLLNTLVADDANDVMTVPDE